MGISSPQMDTIKQFLLQKIPTTWIFVFVFLNKFLRIFPKKSHKIFIFLGNCLKICSSVAKIVGSEVFLYRNSTSIFCKMEPHFSLALEQKILKKGNAKETHEFLVIFVVAFLSRSFFGNSGTRSWCVPQFRESVH